MQHLSVELKWLLLRAPLDQTSYEPLTNCTADTCTANYGQTCGPMTGRVHHAVNSSTCRARVQASWLNPDWHFILLCLSSSSCLRSIKNRLVVLLGSLAKLARLITAVLHCTSSHCKYAHSRDHRFQIDIALLICGDWFLQLRQERISQKQTFSLQSHTEQRLESACCSRQ